MRSGSLSDEAGRPLSEAERDVLLHILSTPFPGAAELRRQVAMARVDRSWDPAGSPSVDISVPADSPRANLSDGPISAAAQVVDAHGEYQGELIVWVSDGRMSALEYSWVTDEPPARLPRTSDIRVSA